MIVARQAVTSDLRVVIAVKKVINLMVLENNGFSIFKMLQWVTIRMVSFMNYPPSKTVTAARSKKHWRKEFKEEINADRKKLIKKSEEKGKEEWGVGQ